MSMKLRGGTSGGCGASNDMYQKLGRSRSRRTMNLAISRAVQLVKW